MNYPTHSLAHFIQVIYITYGMNKRMVQFQTLLTYLFLTLYGYEIHCQQRELFTFVLRYEQFASHAYCGATGPDSKMASKQGKVSCVNRLEVSRSVITAQREFRARFKKRHYSVWCSFLKSYTKHTLHCNNRYGQLKTEHTDSLLLLRRHLRN
jgi:hypothetical protein